MRGQYRSGNENKQWQIERSRNAAIQLNYIIHVVFLKKDQLVDRRVEIVFRSIHHDLFS